MSSLFHLELDNRLKEGYDLWAEHLNVPAPEDYRYIGTEACRNCSGEHAENLACACQCFFWFRYLHGLKDSTALLLGDYFFSQFSLCLIPIDSTPLIDAFSEFLKKETEGALKGTAFEPDRFREFFINIGTVLDD